ncbi:hypothetical protein AVEN_194104-1 [Araneus ventricosus]|uniref:Uncharacterized protein n=1 Tax=Araneus ventricosus TaxID=182803 RepID=A0A4Y2NWG4_ARAVE|nr:hypothetical protein AVEN_194104-1 [Araneus ventricosus]
MRESRCQLPKGAFQFYDPSSKWIINEDQNPNFSSALLRFSLDSRMDDWFWVPPTKTVRTALRAVRCRGEWLAFSIDWFWSGALQIAWIGFSVNVQICVGMDGDS